MIFREEATAALAGFHVSPRRSWSNWNLEENWSTKRKTLGARQAQLITQGRNQSFDWLPGFSVPFVIHVSDYFSLE